jgi:hypothetical protein
MKFHQTALQGAYTVEIEIRHLPNASRSPVRPIKPTPSPFEGDFERFAFYLDCFDR